MANTNEKKKLFILQNRKMSKKMEFTVFFITLILIVIMLWPYVTLTIEGGEVGVYYSRFFGGTVTSSYLSEGFHYKLPWDKIIVYDTRYQSKDFTVTALARGGLSVDIGLSAVWRVDKEQIGSLHKLIGENYAEKIIFPAVESAVRSTVGSYEQSELYDGDPLVLQDQIENLLVTTFQDFPFEITAFLIKEIDLPEKMATSIEEKFVSEQKVLEQRYKVLEAFEAFKKSYIEAESIRFTQQIINGGLTENYLRYMGIEATLKLAESDNAKLVIIGDKDGLPLLFNSDVFDESASIEEGTQIEIDETSITDTSDEYKAKLDELEDTITEYNRLLGLFLEENPEMTDSITSDILDQMGDVTASDSGTISDES
jgi:regulator of protease activity HflC (stomatin/prohibitin superfamily)